MSAHPNIQAPADASRLPMTLPRLFEKKRLRAPPRRPASTSCSWATRAP